MLVFFAESRHLVCTRTTAKQRDSQRVELETLRTCWIDCQRYISGPAVAVGAMQEEFRNVSCGRKEFDVDQYLS